MNERDQQAQILRNDAEPIERARNGAIKCVHALEAVRVSYNVMAESQMHGGEDEHIYLNPRPYIARLYRSLRIAWDPIARVWPQLIEVYRQSYCIENIAANEEGKAPPAVYARLLAHEESVAWPVPLGARCIGTLRE